MFQVSVNDWQNLKHCRTEISDMVFLALQTIIFVFVMLLCSNVVLHLPSLQLHLRHSELILGSNVTVSLKSHFLAHVEDRRIIWLPLCKTWLMHRGLKLRKTCKGI